MRKPAVAIGAIVILLGAYVLFVAPLSEKREELKESLQAEYMALKKYEGLIQSTEKAETGLKAAAAGLKKMERTIIRATDTSLAFSKLQMKIQDIAEASGFRITSIKPLSAVSHTGYTGLPIYLDGTSDIAGLSNFLKALDSTRTFINMERLEVSTAPQGALRTKMRLSGLMKT